MLSWYEHLFFYYLSIIFKACYKCFEEVIFIFVGLILYVPVNSFGHVGTDS